MVGVVQTFKAWQARKQNDKRKREEEKEAERRRKGVMTGREIFLQDGFTAEDDVGASEQYTRDGDEEAEFKRIQAQAEAARQAAHAAAGAHAATAQPSGAAPFAAAACCGVVDT